MSRYDYDPDFASAAPADTPPGAEARLEAYKAELEKAGLDLAEAADAETDAELARDAARDRLLLSPDCPRCGTFDGVRVTVAERDAWVNSRIVDLEREYRHKRRARERAEGKLRILERQGGIQQSITASVRETYRGAGGYR
jgi:hypothetical protein